MIKYTKNKFFPITTFLTEQSAILFIKPINDNSLRKIKQENKENQWSYWRDEELDNFGKIAIGLSRHDCDNEDYSK